MLRNRTIATILASLSAVGGVATIVVACVVPPTPPPATTTSTSSTTDLPPPPRDNGYGVMASTGNRPDGPTDAVDLGASWARVNTEITGSTADIDKYRRWLD